MGNKHVAKKTKKVDKSSKSKIPNILIHNDLSTLKGGVNSGFKMSIC